MAEDILGKVINFIAGGEGADADRRIMLQKMQRDLAQNKYAKFYRVRTEEFEPVFAEALHSIYKLISPAQSMLRDSLSLKHLGDAVVGVFLDAPVREAVKRLSPKSLEQYAGSAISPELTSQLKDDLQAMTNAFDPVHISAIDHCYNLILSLVRLAGFRFSEFLRKFDERYQSSPGYEPHFNSVKATGLIKDLEEFILLIPGLDPGGDWNHAIQAVNLVAGREIIAITPWVNVVRLLRDIQDSGILDLIVRYTLKDPLWVLVRKDQGELLAEQWLETRKSAVERLIGIIMNNQRDVRIAALAASVFGSADITRLSSYTAKASENLIRKGADGFVYAAGLNYLSAFIEDFMNREMQELSEILLIRGQWSNQTLSREMSEALYQIKDLPESINELDISLAEKGREGPRLNAAVLRLEKDPATARYVNSIIGGINNQALNMISTALQAFNVLVKRLKDLTEDCEKRPPDLIINWRELAQASRIPIGQRVAEAYEKVSTFTQLLSLYSDESEEA